MKSLRVAAVGVHVLDIHVIGIESIPNGSDGQLVETIRMSPAGTAGGTALVLSRLGAQVASHGTIGQDPLGDVLVALLEREGVSTAGLRRVDTATQSSASVIPVRPGGDRPAWHCIGANGEIDLDRLDLDAILDAEHLHLGGPEFLGGPVAGDLLARAKAAGLTTSVDVLAPGDPGLLDWIAEALPHTDYLLPNDEQVRGFTGHDDLTAGAKALLERGVGCVAVTQGSKGAVVVTEDETLEVPAFRIEAVDTTGCGDAFSAGFLRARLDGADLAAAARFGCATAAQVAQGLGSDAGEYDAGSVTGFIARAE